MKNKEIILYRVFTEIYENDPDVSYEQYFDSLKKAQDFRKSKPNWKITMFTMRLPDKMTLLEWLNNGGGMVDYIIEQSHLLYEN